MLQNTLPSRVLKRRRELCRILVSESQPPISQLHRARARPPLLSHPTPDLQKINEYRPRHHSNRLVPTHLHTTRQPQNDSINNPAAMRICRPHVCVGEATTVADLRAGCCVVFWYCCVCIGRSGGDGRERERRSDWEKKT